MGIERTSCVTECRRLQDVCLQRAEQSPVYACSNLSEPSPVLSGETDTQMHMVFHRYYGDGVWTCQSTSHLSGGGTVSVPFGPLAKEHISTSLYFVNEDGFTSKSINVR
ncbi:unnamed protein product [Arctogadus glacialis]